ncbi:hypothetical protein VPH35_081870 [Triticum aestivum]
MKASQWTPTSSSPRRCTPSGRHLVFLLLFSLYFLSRALFLILLPLHALASLLGSAWSAGRPEPPFFLRLAHSPELVRCSASRHRACWPDPAISEASSPTRPGPAHLCCLHLRHPRRRVRRSRALATAPAWIQPGSVAGDQLRPVPASSRQVPVEDVSSSPCRRCGTSPVLPVAVAILQSE